MSKLHPKSIETERAVLGLMTSKPELMADCELDPDDFWREDHRSLYRLMQTLLIQGDSIDMRSLPMHVSRTGDADKYGGLSYVIELPEMAGSPQALPHYVKTLKRDSARRKLMDIGHEMVARASEEFGDLTPQELADEVMAKIGAIDAHGKSSEWIDLHDAADTQFQQWADIETSGRGMQGLETGFGVLNSALAGFCSGDLIILAARPSMGKTALMLAFAMSMAMDEDGEGVVGIVSLEMSPESMAGRFAMYLSGVDPERARTGEMTADDWTSLMNARELMATLPIKFVDAPGTTMPAVRSAIRKLQAKVGKIRAVMIDYLQLMGTPKEHLRMSTTDQIGEKSKDAKQLAKDLGCPVFLLSQLSRGVESRADKRPMQSDLRSSGSIEQDADVILFIYRDEYYDPMTQDPGIAEIGIAKQRNGPAGIVKRLGYSKGRFFDAPGGSHDFIGENF